MPVFKGFEKAQHLPLDKEKNLQKLVEDNLMECSTPLSGIRVRVDTLAVDVNGAPVIIEYKRNKKDSAINQALSYLKWLKALQLDDGQARVPRFG
jgi:RecB family endonuclease NucS